MMLSSVRTAILTFFLNHIKLFILSTVWRKYPNVKLIIKHYSVIFQLLSHIAYTGDDVIMYCTYLFVYVSVYITVFTLKMATAPCLS